MHQIELENWVVEILKKEEEKAISSGNPLTAAFLRCYQLMSYGLIGDGEAPYQQDFERPCPD